METTAYKYPHTATYSPEDDKLRIYLAYRLPADEYQTVKDHGFRSAPKQGCVFAVWTPDREDFCLQLAGEIEPEGTTLAERAAAKAERLDDLSQKRARQANSFWNAAHAISERFAYGQPILVGHHSERKARRDQNRMHSAMQKGNQCADAVNYWSYRASSVEHHANYKSRDDVRARRIKKLLSELRSYQRDINEAHKLLELWQVIAKKKGTDEFEKLVGFWCGNSNMSPSLKRGDRHVSCWSLLQDNEITAEEVLEISINHQLSILGSEKKYRCIQHLLNRLAFERSELGEVQRYEGPLSPVILQGFLREHGADSPKATKTERGYKAISPVPFPLHIGDGGDLELNEDEWRDMMHASGYEVPDKKASERKPGIINFKALSVKVRSYGSIKEYPQIQLTKSEYMGIHSDYRGSALSACRTFKVRVCIDPENQTFRGSMFCVFLTDSKEHPAPVSDAVTLTLDEAAEA